MGKIWEMLSLDRANKAEVSDLLTSVSAMTIATSDSFGINAAPVYFVADKESHLFFFSNLKSEHGRNVSHNSESAVAIYPQCVGWRDIKGVQLKGNTYLVKGTVHWDCIWKLYENKFSFVKKFKSLAKFERLFEFIPTWIRLIDNRKNFGLKTEWTLQEFNVGLILDSLSMDNVNW